MSMSINESRVNKRILQVNFFNIFKFGSIFKRFQDSSIIDKNGGKKSVSVTWVGTDPDEVV